MKAARKAVVVAGRVGQEVNRMGTYEESEEHVAG